MKRIRQKITSLALASFALLGATPARADPGSVAVVLSTVMSVETAVAVTVAIYSYGAYVLTGYAIYGSIQARNKARRAAAAARAAYNAGLQDRNITALSEAPGWRVIYGRADTGGDIVAMFTTDKTDHALTDFRAGTVVKPDALKHIIVVWSARQCQAINDIKIDGVPVGAMDTNGWATGDEWKKSNPQPTASGTLAGNLRTYAMPTGFRAIISVTLLSGTNLATQTPISNGAGGWSISGSTLSLPGSVQVAGFAYTPTASDVWDVRYSGDDIDGTSTIRVRHHLGASDQAADAELIALLPDKWTVNHRLLGRCYSWITLDLERAQFQGGPPGITADITGALVLDPRSGVTAWSANPALCAYDYLRFIGGMKVSAAEVDTASVIASANVCDEATTFTISGTPVVGPRYTCNGVFVCGPDKEPVLIDICESMAGWASYGGIWRVIAGSWTPPVMDLDDRDLHGSINIVQAGEPSGELFNSVKGQYVPAGSAVPADTEPYSNAAFVAADGGMLWEDVEYPFTNSNARATNIHRIKVEQSRNGLVIFYPAKLRAWRLQTGDRVRVTSAEYGFNLKAFRVTDWQFGLRSPVGLTLQEDGEDAWDGLDAHVADPTPNTTLPNPWRVDPLTSVSAASGTAQLQKLGDGTIISRVLVTWPRSTASYMQDGRIQIAWIEVGTNTAHYEYAAGDDTQLYLTGVRDGAVIMITALAINTQDARSAGVWTVHKVLGKSEAPAQVQGLALSLGPGFMRCSRTPSTEVDYDHTIYRYGASFAAGTKVPGRSDENGFTWDWPALGSYTIWAADVDTSGNIGTPVSATITVDSSVLIGAGQSASTGGALNKNPACSDPTAWTQLAAAPPTFRQAVSGAPGGTTVGNASGGASQVGSDRFAIDPTQHYTISIMAARLDSSTAATAYIGISWHDINGTLIVSSTVAPAGWNNGTYSYYGLIGQNPPATFTRYEVAFGPGTGRAIPSSAASARIIALLNYNGTAGAIHCIADARVYNIEAAYQASVAAAAAAQAAADAQADADSANALLADISADNKLTAGEKQALRQRWDALINEKAGINAQAAVFAITTENTAYNTAIQTLGTYLNAGVTYTLSTSTPPSWINDANLGVTTAIAGATLRSNWIAATNARQALMNAIAAKAKALADAAQLTASDAAAAAADAQADADAANQLIADISSDGKLTPSEKQALRKEWNSIIGAWSGIDVQAAAMAITTERSAHNTTLTALGTYLNGGTAWIISSTPPLWISDAQLSVTTNVTGATLRSTWKAYTDAKQTLLNRIAAVAATLADWAGVGGAGKPLDNAGKIVDLGAGTTTFGQRQRNDAPNEYPVGLTMQFKQMSSIGLTATGNGYCTLETNKGYTDNTGVNVVQYAYDSAGAAWKRYGLPAASSWAGAWVQDLDRNAYTGDLAATQNQVFFQDTDPVTSPGGVVNGAIWVSSTKAWQRVSGAWKPYVGNGSVDTSQIVSTAVTELASFSGTLGHSNIG